MKIDEFYNYTRLFDVYGKLLSKKQFEVMDKLLNNDLGESEIAQNLDESRQSIHDAITKAKKQLESFEEKCGVLKTLENAKVKLVNVKAFLKNNSKNQEQVVCLIDDIIDNI